MNFLKDLEYKVLQDINLFRIYDGLEYDSRKIKENFIFIALEGYTVDGHDFIDKAYQNGATCILVSKEVEIKYNDISYVFVEDLKENLSKIASNFYDYPQNKVTMIGITGTNGKTTTSYMMEHILGENETARLGTIEYKIGNEVFNATNTTPEAPELIKLINMAYKKGLKYVVMEVSSHALELGRVKNINFDYAIFTNLSQDHLDYHKNMENYFNAKKKLFYKLKDKNNMIINIDDEYGKRIASEFQDYDILDYGMHLGKLKAYHSDRELILEYDFKKYRINPHIFGNFNIYNMLASIGVAIKIGINFDDILKKIDKLKTAPGRFEPVVRGQDFKVIVDYAHTPDALENVLKTMNDMKKNRIITVFGCGGDRDKTKRPIMAAISEKYSEIVIATSDNPRTENPENILADVLKGFKSNKYISCIDREKAISLAIEMAEKDDIILIAGKGHENYQIIGRTKIHFDDREIAEKYINNKLSDNFK